MFRIFITFAKTYDLTFEFRFDGSIYTIVFMNPITKKRWSYYVDIIKMEFLNLTETEFANKVTYMCPTELYHKN